MLDFDLRVDSDDPAAQRLRVAVSASPAGEVDPVVVVAPAITLEQALAADRPRLVDLATLITTGLMPPPVWLAWRESVGRAGQQGIRLRVRTRQPALAGLPWELLYDAERERFLALDRQVSIVRYLEGPITDPRPAGSGPLRLMLASAAPHDQADLAVEVELDRVEAALGPLVANKQVALTRLDHLRAPVFAAELIRVQPHVFHFAGHALRGGMRGQGGAHWAGALALEDQWGRTDDRLTAPILASLLAGAAVRLAVLNACETAVGGAARWSGLAQALALAGAAAVVAMQARLSDAAAGDFAVSLYRALSAGHDLEQCMGHARRAMMVSSHNEWLIPALFQRVAALRLLPAQEESLPEAQGMRTSPSAPRVQINQANIQNWIEAGEGPVIIDQRGQAVHLSSQTTPGQRAKLDELQADLTALREQLLARFDRHEQSVIAAIVGQTQTVLDALAQGRIDATEMEPMLAALASVLAELRDQGERLAHLGASIDLARIENAVADPSLDWRHKLKITAPIVPWLLSYEGELDLSSGVNLRVVWEKLLARLSVS